MKRTDADISEAGAILRSARRATQAQLPRSATLFESLPTPTIVPQRRARRADPATSQAAARRVDEFAPNHYGAIMLALRNGGPLTVSEIAARTQLAEQQINKRLPELASRKYRAVRVVVIDGIEQRRPGASGRAQRIWEIVP